MSQVLDEVGAGSAGRPAHRLLEDANTAGSKVLHCVLKHTTHCEAASARVFTMLQGCSLSEAL